MEKNEIKEYLEDILTPKLIELRVSDSYRKEIVKHIETQMYSLLKHWNEAKFRETVLFIGLEEGNFYQPKEASLKVKCFVVVTIRNSLLETIVSNDCKAAGLEKPISDEELINITSTAIRYFNSVNLRKIAEKIDYDECDDIYFKVASKYPVAWNALKQLCFCTGKEQNYEKVQEYKKIYLQDLQPREEVKKDLNSKNYHIDYQSGITAAFSNELIEFIKRVLEHFSQRYFYTDCFKHITRNIEKLLMVIELLLQNDKVFLTSNYYISNDYIAKRTKILRASHKTEEIRYKMTQLNGLADKHSAAIKNILNMT